MNIFLKGFSEKEVIENADIQSAIKISMAATLPDVTPGQVKIIAINNKRIESDAEGRHERIRRLSSLAVRVSFEIVDIVSF